MKIKKGDKIIVEKGKNSGKTGIVKKVIKDSNKVIVEGINIVKKHVKPKGKDTPGGILEMESPINVSNIMVVCSSCNKKTRVSYKITDKRKERVCKKCNQVLDKVKG